jgi:hypothetical protein
MVNYTGRPYFPTFLGILWITAAAASAAGAFLAFRVLRKRERDLED